MLLLICLCLISSFVLCGLFGKSGMAAYIALAVFVANIQVLKVASVSIFGVSCPLALGTVIFSSTFWVIDAAVELYGERVARELIALGFASMILSTAWMLWTVAMPSAHGSGTQAVQQALVTLFSPQLALVVASLVAYVVSQLCDVSVFAWLKRRTHQRHLWLRSIGSTIAANAVDHLVFSLMAWCVLKARPVDWSTLLVAYMGAGFVLRLLLSLPSPVLIYMIGLAAKARIIRN